MSSHSIRARAPLPGAPGSVRIGRDADVLAAYLEDAAHFPGGFAAGIAAPASEADVAALLRSAASVLPIGAQSSLTGGTTRDWVRSLTVVLPGGEVLDIERGATIARDGSFDLVLSGGTVRVPVPTYHMPRVRKVSAGYFAAPDMDLIDLFIGSEGTLGVITEATLEILPSRPAVCLAFVPFRHR